MKRKWLIIGCVLVLVSFITYKQVAAYPLKQDLKGGTLIKMHDMNHMLIAEYPEMDSYMTTDLQEIKEINAILMDVQVKKGPIFEEFSRDDEVLKVRFSNDDTTFAITYTFYANGDFVRKEVAMVTRFEMYRQVSGEELERVKALVLEGKTLD